MKFGTIDQYGERNVWEFDSVDLLEVKLEIEKYWAALGSDQRVVSILALVADNG